MRPILRAVLGNLARPTTAAPDVSLAHRDCGSCNGCEIELRLLAAQAPSVRFVAAAGQADALLVTGPVTYNTQAGLGADWDAMPEPRRVIALGDCAIDGGVFKGSYAVAGGASSTVPVTQVIRGCPPSPQQILAALAAPDED